MTDRQIENLLWSVHEKIVNKKGKIDTNLVKIVVEEEFGIILGHNRTYRLKTALEYHHPHTFR